SIQALASSYANAGYMGIPLCLMLFGESSLPAVVIATLLTACGLFAFSIIVIEFDLHAGNGWRRSLRKVGINLLRNPLVSAPLLGLFIALMEWELPSGVLQFTTLLGAAASPCALITIGLFLSQGARTPHHHAVW